MCRLDFPLLRVEVVGTVADVLGKSEGVTEELKSRDQLEWVRRMNSIRNRAEEVVIRDLIYN